MHLAFSFPRVLVERLPLGSCFHTGRFDGPPRGKPLGVPQNNSEGIVKLGEPLAEIVGFGASCDGYRLTDTPPDGNGIARSMQAALADARLVPEEIDYINAHGTATPQNDVSETWAIKAVFGAHGAKLPVSSTKSMAGHMVAAAGAMEAVICVLGLRNGLVFATATLRESDPQCDLDYVPGACRERALRIALSNSCGLGRQNGTLIFRVWR